MGESAFYVRRTFGIAVISLGTFAIMAFVSGTALADTVPAPSQGPTADVVIPTQASTTPTDNEAGAPDTTTQAAAATTDNLLTDTGASSASNTTPSEGTTATNTTVSAAQSGDATVDHNGSAGNATSGNTAASATAIISAGSSTVGGQNIATFVVTVPGDNNGDLFIDPTKLANGNSTTATTTGANDQTTTNVSACATSGDASVTNNGTAGSATSGNADAEANVLTLADSDVSTPEFFVGTINVYGNLNGNILLPSDFASSALSPSVSSSSQRVTSSINVVNAITASAQSGNASVEHNTAAGSATSGSATTSINECDVVDSQFAGSGVVFVLVNVEGKWTGFVMDGPAAAITALGTNDASDTLGVMDAGAATQTVTNNILTSAKSGNALVANNSAAGNATSGNAVASVELLDLVASTIKTSHWFGVLFINVFGDWIGGLAASPIAPTGSIMQMPSDTIVTPIVPLVVARLSVGPKQNLAHTTALATSTAIFPMLRSQTPPASLNIPLGAANIRTASATSANSHGLTVAGIVLGALALAECAAGIAYLCARIKRSKDSENDNE